MMVLGPQQIEKATITNLTTMNAFFQLARLKNFDNRGEKKIFPKQYFSNDSDSQLVLSQTNVGNFLKKIIFFSLCFSNHLISADISRLAYNEIIIFL